MKPRPSFALAPAVLGVFLLTLLPLPQAFAAESPTLSLRAISPGAYEVEFYAGQWGLMYTHGVAQSVEGKDTPACQGVLRTHLVTARRFFTAGASGAFLGITGWRNRVWDRGGCALEEYRDSLTAGVFPALGYQWRWASGLEFEVGVRPGMFALGWSF